MNTFGSFFLISCITVSSAWHLRVSLNDIFKGNCRTVSPRVCRKSLQAFDPDYSCGFILRSVCSGTNKIERVRTRRSALMVRQHWISRHFLQYCSNERYSFSCSVTIITRKEGIEYIFYHFCLIRNAKFVIKFQKK